MKKLTTVAVILIFASIHGGTAQGAFNHRHNLGVPAGFIAGVIATDSCYYATGKVFDEAINTVSNVFVKFDLEGSPVIVKKYGFPNKWLSTDEAAFEKTPDGNLIVAGTLIDTVRRAVLLKYTPEGDTLFTKTYEHPAFPDIHFLYINDLLVTPDGGVLLVGNMSDASGGPDTDFLAIRADSLGNQLWTGSYGSGFNDFGVCAVADATGEGFYLGGIHQNTNLLDEGYTFQAQFFHLDGDGEKDWGYLTPDSYLSDWAHDMVLLPDGGLVVASGVGTEVEHVSVNTVDFEKSVFKLGPQGGIEWEVVFPADEPVSTAHMEKLVKLADGSGFVAAGAAAEILQPQEVFIIRGWLAKVTNEGAKVWEREYTVTSELDSRHWVYDMKECPDGGFILCGEARDMSGQDSIPQQAWLLKLDGHGCLVPGCHLTDATDETALPEIELAIYPNPTADYLNFQLRGGNANKNAAFRITDAQGRLVREFESASAGATLIVPVWEWAAGVYFLQYVEGGEVRASERFVVVR